VLAGSTVSRALSVADSVGVAVALGLGEVDASPDPGSDGETSQGSSVAAFDCAALADGSPVVAWAVPDSMRAAVVRAIRVE